MTLLYLALSIVAAIGVPALYLLLCRRALATALGEERAVPLLVTGRWSSRAGARQRS